MEPIIKPVDRLKLEQELTKEKFFRKTNNSNNDIYIFTYHDSPNLMREVGRLREISFRTAGGGTGKMLDIDEFDISEEYPNKQLIVWNPVDKEIIGGYRFIKCRELLPDKTKTLPLATAHLFHFSDKFINEYLPYTIELGRSFVQPYYQPVENSRKGIFSLDNLWDGLGAIVVNNPDIKYFFGKVTMYTNFTAEARDLILFFLNKYFPDKENLVYPFIPLKYKTEIKKLESFFSSGNYNDDYRSLVQNVRKLNESIPPLMNAYMNLSSTMLSFGTAINDSFGGVEETAILINIDDIYNIKKERHITGYTKII